MARDVQRPDIVDVTTDRPTQPDRPELFHPEDEDRPRSRPGAYWIGLVVLTIGLAVTVGTLATRVTSIVQTVLLAVPLALIGLGLERVGRGTGRGSLRTVGVLLLVVATVGPLVLSLSNPEPAVTVAPSEPVPSGAAQAELRASMGGGQLQVDSGAPGLFSSDLRGPGEPSVQVTTTANNLAVLDLRAPPQRGVLARNRGNDWRIRLNTSLDWQLDVSAGAVTADLDLRDLDLRRLNFQSGVSRLAVRLGDPAVEVPIDLQLSTGLVDLYLPRTATVELQIDGLSVNNFGSAGLTNNGGIWRVEGSGPGRYYVRVRTSGARIQVHRL